MERFKVVCLLTWQEQTVHFPSSSSHQIWGLVQFIKVALNILVLIQAEWVLALPAASLVDRTNPPCSSKKWELSERLRKNKEKKSNKWLIMNLKWIRLKLKTKLIWNYKKKRRLDMKLNLNADVKNKNWKKSKMKL